MTTTATGITIERTLAAGIQRVYDAWTKPELMVRWYCPNPALDLTAEADLRVGGDWVVLRHTGFASAEDVANHAEGWEGCVERLPGLLASQSPA